MLILLWSDDSVHCMLKYIASIMVDDVYVHCTGGIFLYSRVVSLGLV